MKKLGTTIISIVLIIGILVGGAMIYHKCSKILWNNGICFSCEQAEWEFDGVYKGASEWYCPNCYETISIIK